MGQADAQTAIDQQIFVQYAKAVFQKKADLATSLKDDLSPDLKRAVDAWLAQKSDSSSPFDGENATYEQPLYDQGAKQLAQSRRQFAQADATRKQGDRFTLIVVFLASSLFLYGIASATSNRRVRLAMTAVGAFIFAGATVALIVTVIDSGQLGVGFIQ